MRVEGHSWKLGSRAEVSRRRGLGETAVDAAPTSRAQRRLSEVGWPWGPAWVYICCPSIWFTLVVPVNTSFTLKSVPVWMTNYMVTHSRERPQERERKLTLSQALPFSIICLSPPPHPPTSDPPFLPQTPIFSPFSVLPFCHVSLSHVSREEPSLTPQTQVSLSIWVTRSQTSVVAEGRESLRAGRPAFPRGRG